MTTFDRVEGTSLNDLAEAMGIASASIYAMAAWDTLAPHPHTSAAGATALPLGRPRRAELTGAQGPY